FRSRLYILYQCGYAISFQFKIPLDFPPKMPVDLFGFKGSNVFAFSSIPLLTHKHSFHPRLNRFFLRSSWRLLNFERFPFAMVKFRELFCRMAKQCVAPKLGVTRSEDSDTLWFISYF